jgi:ribosomal protein L34E
MITAGLLSFGAGILVNEVFSDDDDDDDYYDDYYPQWGGGYGGAYYPPPYQPRYGNGYRPSHNYNRPVNYQRGSNNNIYVKTDGNDYFNRFDSGKNNYRRNPDSPISSARRDRPELAELNNRKPTLDRPHGGYAGARPEVREAAGLGQRPTSVVKPPGGTYAGARPELRDAGGLANRPGSSVKPPGGSYDGAKLASKERSQIGGTRDRGHAESLKDARPSGGGALAGAAKKPQTKLAQSGRPGGFQGSRDSGRSERAASKRGRESMSQRPRPSANRSGGGGGGGGRLGNRR